MEGQADSERERALSGVDNSAAEGDGDGGRYSMMVRCASQSSLDESSQRPASGGAGADAHAAQPARLLAALARLRRDGVLCDVRLHARAAPLLAPSAALPAHRAVLAAASPYFHAMFTQFDESTQPTVTIQNVEPAALEAIVEYVYTPDSLVITEDNVQSLLAAASLLAVGGVRAACCVFLAGALAPDNALGIRAFADLHACADLSTAAARFIENHFAEVLDTEEFLALEADTLAQLLDNDRITVPSEEAILDAVVRWMQQEPGARAPHLGALLEHVRLPLLAQDALVARANAEPLCSAGLRVKDLVIEALSYHLMRPERRAACAAACARARPRQPPRAPRVLLVVGGQAPKAVRDVEAFQLDAARWRPSADLLTRRCRAGLGVVGGKVYAVGGFNGTLRVRSVDLYDVATDTWSAGPPLCARRSTLGVAVIGHVIYAVGGFDGATGLSSAEALDTREGVWRPVAPMSTRRSSVGVGVLGGKLYAVGGYDGASRQCLHTVERYDPAADAWEPVEQMGARRSGCGVGVVDGALYAVGGHDGPAVRRSVERWAGAGWAAAPPMHTARRNAAVAAHLGRLYVVGGDDGAANLSSVEVFDPAASSWALLPASMSLGRSYAGVTRRTQRTPRTPHTPRTPPTLCACICHPNRGTQTSACTVEPAWWRGCRERWGWRGLRGPRGWWRGPHRSAGGRCTCNDKIPNRSTRTRAWAAPAGGAAAAPAARRRWSSTRAPSAATPCRACAPFAACAACAWRWTRAWRWARACRPRAPPSTWRRACCCCRAAPRCHSCATSCATSWSPCASPTPPSRTTTECRYIPRAGGRHP